MPVASTDRVSRYTQNVSANQRNDVVTLATAVLTSTWTKVRAPAVDDSVMPPRVRHRRAPVSGSGGDHRLLLLGRDQPRLVGEPCPAGAQEVRDDDEQDAGGRPEREAQPGEAEHLAREVGEGACGLQPGGAVPERVEPREQRGREHGLEDAA